ncbi:hypothetical protein HYW74_03465 [Candidatus Pacearchaeota archaeon]|nr:hypothetical protein [Candidatus Pacearchaeota archaeon]
METIPRPEGYMENPYKGDDGRDYHNPEDLARANEEYRRFYSQKERDLSDKLLPKN